jgi:hypothetical protein
MGRIPRYVLGRAVANEMPHNLPGVHSMRAMSRPIISRAAKLKTGA